MNLMAQRGVLETLMAAVLVAGLVVADVKKNRINR